MRRAASSIRPRPVTTDATTLILLPLLGCSRHGGHVAGRVPVEIDPHRTPASRLRPTAIAVSELLTAALAGPVRQHVLLMCCRFVTAFA
jgi:hypothetical protein